MDSDGITIKGIRDGLMITLGDGPLPNLLDTLAGRLTEQGQFFRGGQVTLSVGERDLTMGNLEEFAKLLSEYEMTLWTVLSDNESTQTVARLLKLGTRLPGSGTELVGALPPAEPREPALVVEPEVAAPPISSGYGTGILVRGALRSGRVIHGEGHVVVIGDVNPGAEIIAGGDVIVWGKLRGLVHAGAYGDSSAVVCALELTPTQLRIAEFISVSPAGRDKEPVPEMASIKSKQIVAESWSPGYRGRR